MWCSTDCSWRKGWKFDGIFGPQTREGVMMFQRHHKLKVDGVVGHETLKALGLPAGASLSQGDKGARVLAVQHALAHHKCNMMHKPMPKPKPKPKPTPMPTMAPTPEPTPMPTPMPTEAPTAPPSQEPMSGPQINLELRGGDFMVPSVPGGTDFDWTLKRPAWSAGGTLWCDNWGLGGGTQTFSPLALDNANTKVWAPLYMYNADLRWRSDSRHWMWSLGYRGMNLPVAFNGGEVGVEWNYPLGMDWLYIVANANGGSNFSSAYFADAMAGLELRLGPVGLGLGYRDLYLNSPAAGTMVNWAAPQGTVRLLF